MYKKPNKSFKAWKKQFLKNVEINDVSYYQNDYNFFYSYLCRLADEGYFKCTFKVKEFTLSDDSKVMGHQFKRIK